MNKLMSADFWYILMIVAFAVSLVIFFAGAGVLGYGDKESAHSGGIFLGLWAPTFGIMGLRAQLKRLGK